MTSTATSTRSTTYSTTVSTSFTLAPLRNLIVGRHAFGLGFRVEGHHELSKIMRKSRAADLETS